MKNICIISLIVWVFLPLFNPAFTSPDKVNLLDLVRRVGVLEQENKELKELLSKVLRNEIAKSEAVLETQDQNLQARGIQTNHDYSFMMLDHTTRVNQKQKTLLEHKQGGFLDQKSIYIGGSITPIMNYQKSNTDSKFGYLMRHPTSNNQLGKNVSEAVLHSAELNFTANLSDRISAYAEFLYDPEQSFGQGTITALARNQVQLRKGYLLYGDLKSSPYYASIGKMAVPFGLTDTVNPFTSSTVWHAFGGLSYGALLGYSKDRWNLSFDAIQGGSQFRAANVPVNASSVPSRLNNLSFDINYTKPYGEKKSMLLGASYLKGSAYCQGFPVVHFNPCSDHNPAYAVYTQLKTGSRLFQAEFAETLDEWPGTFNRNPPLNRFAASKVRSFQVGVRDRRWWKDKPVDVSLEFSRFVAGDDGSPWERQDQIVLGAAHHLTSSVKLFSELIRVSGYAPLNFISGGHIPAQPGLTHSARDARSTVLLMGVDAAF